MIGIYMWTLMVLMVILAVICAIILVKKNEYYAEFFRLLVVTILVMLSYGTFLMTKNHTVAMLFNGLYFCGTDWMLLCLMDYVFTSCELSINTKLYKRLFLTLGIVDTVSMLVNVKTEHVFSLTRDVHDRVGIEYWSNQFHRVEYWHLGFCYVLVMVLLIALIYKICKTPRMYHKVYLAVLIPFSIIIVANAICYTIDFPMDFSVLIYTAFGISICYYSIYSVPKGLVEDLLRNVVEDFRGGIVCYDLKGKCIYYNHNATLLMSEKYQSEKVPFEHFYQAWREDNPGILKDYETWEETIQTGDTERYIKSEYQRLTDEKGNTIGHVFRATDQTEDISRHREERYQATHDRLTGLYNKEYFFQKVAQVIERRPEVRRYMVCTNIRNFKMLNELFGEEMGDRMLANQAAMLKVASYEDCVQGRVGSDKFAMLIAAEDFKIDLADRNSSRLEYMLDESNFSVQILLGIYRIEDPTEDPQSMYEKAYAAATAGDGDFRKRIVFYDGTMLDKLKREKTVISEFDRAIRDKEFKIYLQPLVAADGKLKGAEALVRWIHPTQGIIMPGDFIPIIEKAGMIITMDTYVWELAAEKLSDWKKRGLDQYSISVNISAKDFYYTDLFETFKGLVEKYDIDPAKFNLEITETVLMSDLDVHMQILEKLREYGFHIEMDDFGSGYSSLNMLKDIMVDALKIDMLFLRETENKVRSRIILRSIISMARELGIEVITEGVETVEQLKALADMGCETFQGYYFSRPISESEFEEKYFK